MRELYIGGHKKGKGIKKLLEQEKNIVILNMMFYGNMGRY
jgi:hypothetical protein